MNAKHYSGCNAVMQQSAAGFHLFRRYVVVV